MGCCSKNKVTVLQQEEREFHGPLAKRSCTDIPFLMFFLLYLGGMGYIGYLGYQTGDPYRLLFGLDSWGNTCNQRNEPIDNVTLSGRDLTGYKYRYHYDAASWFSDLLPGDADKTVVCIKQCPNETLLTPGDLQDFYDQTDSNLCRYDILPDDTASDDLCPDFPIVATFPMMSYCIPQMAADYGESVMDAILSVAGIQAQCANSHDFLMNLMNDVKKTWKELLYLSAVAFGASIITTFLLRFFAAIMIWIMILGSGLGCLVGSGYGWYIWYTYRTELKQIPADHQVEEDKKRVQQWLIYACCGSGIGLIVLLILLVMRKRIMLVVQLFREAGKAVAKLPLILLQPIWTILAVVFFGGSLGLIGMYVVTSGQPVVQDNGYVEIETSDIITYAKWFFALGIIWVIQLIYSGEQLIIAGAVAKWYFTRNKSKIGCATCAATKRLIFYHLGSVALGSFIVAVTRMIRIILAYINAHLRGKTNKVAQYLMKCLMFCMWCFEKLIKFLNRNAYIMIAIYGTNFCSSAKKAFTVVLSNVLRVAAINSVGTFCLFLGKCGVTAITVLVGFFFFKDDPELCYMFVPLIISGIVAFWIAHLFLGVYSMVIDTIFLCFCEDCGRNDGISSPYFMDVSLMKFVDNSGGAIAAYEARQGATQDRKSVKVAW